MAYSSNWFYKPIIVAMLPDIMHTWTSVLYQLIKYIK